MCSACEKGWAAWREACSLLSPGPLLTSDLQGLSPLYCRSQGSCCPGSLLPLSVDSPSSSQREGCRLMQPLSLGGQGGPNTLGGCKPGWGLPATVRVLTPSSLSSHRKTWFPTTQICTNAKHTNITPISAVMEKATVVSTKQDAPRPSCLPSPNFLSLAWAPK